MYRYDIHADNDNGNETAYHDIIYWCKQQFKQTIVDAWWCLNIHACIYAVYTIEWMVRFKIHCRQTDRAKKMFREPQPKASWGPSSILPLGWGEVHAGGAATGWVLKLNGSSVDGAFDDVRCFKVVIFLVRCAVYFAGPLVSLVALNLRCAEVFVPCLCDSGGGHAGWCIRKGIEGWGRSKTANG